MRHNNSKRSRGRGGRRSGSQSLNRSFDSNGPSGKLRGTPAQLSEKYQAMARDARAGRDRVLVESYFQHAEHYQRLANEIAETQAAAAAENEQRQSRGRDGDGRAKPQEQQAEQKPNQEGEGSSKPKPNGAEQILSAPEAQADQSESVEAPRRPPRRRRRAPDAAAAPKEAEPSAEAAVEVEKEETKVTTPVEAAG